MVFFFFPPPKEEEFMGIIRALSLSLRFLLHAVLANEQAVLLFPQ